MTTLADLIARAHVYRPNLSESVFQGMRRAVLRVAEAAGKRPQDVEAENVLEVYASLEGGPAISEKQFREERSCLKRLLALPALPLDLAERISSGTATLADALAALELQLDQPRWSQVGSALRRFAEALETGLNTIVSGNRIEALLGRLSHTDFGVQPNTWAVRKSLIRKGVRLVDLQGRQRLSKSMLTGNWRNLIDSASPGRGQKGSANGRKSRGHDIAKVWPLVEFCWRQRIEPAAVDDQVIERLLADLQARKNERAFDIARAVVYAWENLQRDVSGWPAQKLKRLYKSPGTTSPHALRFEELPDCLQQSWHDYVRRFFVDDTTQPASLADLVVDAPCAGSDDGGVQDHFAQYLKADRSGSAGAEEKPRHLRNAATLPNFRTVFLFAANAAIGSLGLAPASLADLLTPAVLNRVLAARHARQQMRAKAAGEQLIPSMKNATLKHTVTIFSAMAKDLEIDEKTVKLINESYELVDPDFIELRNGKRRYRDWRIGPSHAAMLQQFELDGGAQKLLAWFRLPGDLFASVKRKFDAVGAKGLTDEDVCDLITALVGAIMRSCPLRRENIGELRVGTCKVKNLGPNLYVPRERGRDATIRLWAGEVKKHTKEINVWLTPFATQVLRFYLDNVRPDVLRRRKSDPENPYLFPSYGPRHRPLGLITRHWVSRCRDAGFRLDLHANRHLTARLVLDQDINAMPLVQQILGHQSIETTQKYYAEIKDKKAQKVFQNHLQEAERLVTAELLVSFRKVA